MIKAKIIYQWGNEREEEILEVTLHLTTYEYGAIDIEEGKILMTGIVHLSFKLIYQGYKFTKDGNLKIIGRDSPLLGNYEVLIVPL